MPDYDYFLHDTNLNKKKRPSKLFLEGLYNVNNLGASSQELNPLQRIKILNNNMIF